MDGSALAHHISERLKANRLNDANLSKLIFDDCRMASCEFMKSNMTNSFLKNCVMHNLSVNDSSLTECRLNGINFGSKPALLFVKESCFSKSKFNDCDFSHCSFDKCRFDATLFNGKSLDRLVKAERRLKVLFVTFISLYGLSVGGLLFYFLKK